MKRSRWTSVRYREHFMVPIQYWSRTIRGRFRLIEKDISEVDFCFLAQSERKGFRKGARVYGRIYG